MFYIYYRFNYSICIANKHCYLLDPKGLSVTVGIECVCVGGGGGLRHQFFSS
jgi:hypothetical protein